MALLAFLLSFVLEVAQYVANVGRTADVEDALLNTAGAVVGWLAWRSLARFRTRA